LPGYALAWAGNDGHPLIWKESPHFFLFCFPANNSSIGMPVASASFRSITVYRSRLVTRPQGRA
jgi:hypothetical protein